jgi:hypothetical protein
VNRWALVLLLVFGCLVPACKREDAGAVSPSPVARPRVVAAEGVARVWSGEPVSDAEVAEFIERLDTAARLHSGLERGEVKTLLGHLGEGRPASLSAPAWQHFFNSACNALAATTGVGADAMAPMLFRVLAEDRDKVMRLYALQHLGNLHPGAPEPVRSQIGRRVLELAGSTDDVVAGTAMDLLERWHGELGAEIVPASAEVRAKMAVATMLDPRRAADVRSSAVHMAVDGGFLEALPAARQIATDPQEDVLLRKASIHLIGQLGVEADTELLTRCAKENLRLAQAADPALISLSDRLAGRIGPTMTPYEELLPK